MSDESSDESDGETTGLAEEYTNAKDHLNQQVMAFREFANEAQRMLRITLLSIGLLITALSAFGPELAQQTLASRQCAVMLPWMVCIPVDKLVIFSGVLLSFSAVFNMIGNESRAIASPGETHDIDQLLREESWSEKEYYRTRLNIYSDRIEYNARILSIIESALAYGKATFAWSIVSLVMVAVAVISGPISGTVSTIALVILIGGGILLLRKFPDEYIAEDSSIYYRIVRRILLTGDDYSPHFESDN